MDKIFINIAAYRDPLLVRTLQQAYREADNPEALIFALGMQYEDSIYPDLSFIPKDQIRIINYVVGQQPGVTRIRYEISTAAFSNEKYFLMIDSHMLFHRGWDTWLKKSLHDLGEKPIITGMGAIHDDVLDLSICDVVQGGRELAFTRKEFSVPIKQEEYGKFYRTPYIACGFMFTYGSFVNEVGFDEFSQFDGEEIYLTWRAFMSGWTIYHTSKWVINHSPENYYDVAWGGPDKRSYTRAGTETVFRPYMTMMKSLAYVYNDYSHYAIKNASRKPVDWFIECGYTEIDYKKILNYYDKLIHNNVTEHDIIIL
jgi:hypothetical protein